PPVVFHQHVEERLVRYSIDFVENQNGGLIRASDLGQLRLHGLDLLFGIGTAGINDVQKQSSLPSLFQRRLERGYEPMRQFPNESHCIAEKYPSPVFNVPLTRSRIERRKEPVLNQHGSTRERIHERALAGIRVPDQRYGMLFSPGPDFALF